MWIPTDEEELVLKNASDGKSEDFSTQAYCRVAAFDCFSPQVGSARSA